MKKFRVMLIVVVLVLLVFCLGCNRLPWSSSSGVGQTDKPLSPWDMDFHKGTNGLTIKIVDKQPPSEVWENSFFQIALELKNEGASDIQNGKLWISDYNFLDINDMPATFVLKGKSLSDPEGGFDIKTFPVRSLEVKDDDKTTTFTITACYEYETSVGVDICINPNVLDIAKIKEGECKPSTVSKAGGQGAPVAITKVEEDFIPYMVGDSVVTRVLFKIHLSNQGGGNVVKTDAFEKKCMKDNPFDPVNESNVIHVSGVSFSSYNLVNKGGKNEIDNYRINCSGFMDANDDLKIPIKGDAILECNAILKDSSAYTTPLIIDLDYGYTNYVTRSITIKNIKGT